MKRKRKVVNRVITNPSATAGAADDVQVDPAMYSDDDGVHVAEEIETRETSWNKRGQRSNYNKAVVNNVIPGSASAKLARALSSSRANGTNDRLPLQRQTIGQKEPKSSSAALLYSKQELDEALLVIKKIMEMDAAIPFNIPVDPMALGIPDYFDIIDTPMDFGTIRSKIERGLEYKNSEDVFKDVQLVWDNCAKYNKKGSHILELMKRVKVNFMKQWAAAGLYMEQQTVSKGQLPHSTQPFAESAMRHEEDIQMSPVGSTIKDSAYLPHYSSPYLTRGPHHQQFSPCCNSPALNPGHMLYQYPRSLHHHDMVPQHSHSATHMYPRHGHSPHFPDLPPHILHQPSMDHILAFNHEHAYHLPQHSGDRIHSQYYQMDSVSPATPYRHPSTSHVVPMHQIHQRAYDRFHTSHPEGGENIEHAGNLRMLAVESTVNCNTKRGTGSERSRPAYLQAYEHLESSNKNQEESSPPERLHSAADNNTSKRRRQVLERPHIQEQSSPNSYREEFQPVRNSPRNTIVPRHLDGQTDSLAKMNLLAEMDALEKRRNELLAKLQNEHERPTEDVLERTRGDLSSKQKGNLYHAPVPQFLPASVHLTGPSNLHTQSEGPDSDPGPLSLPASVHPTCLSNLHIQSGGPVSNSGPQSPPASVHPTCPTNLHIQSAGPASDSEPLEHSSRHHNSTHSNSNSHHSASTLNVRQGTPSQSYFPLDDVEGSSDNDVQSVPSQPTIKKGRGRARRLKSSDIGPIHVEFNEHYLPVGENAAKLSTQIGCAARDGKRFSLTVPDWRLIDQESKEKAWEEHKAMFNLDVKFKNEYMRRLGVLWRDMKSKVKKNHYLKYSNDAERLANCPPEVEKDQWPVLVNYWSSESFQRVSDMKKFSRSKRRVPSRTGRHTFAAVKHKLTKEKGEEPCKFDFWMATHIEPAKSPLDKQSDEFVKNLTQAISENPQAMESKELRDELLAKILGPKQLGKMRSYGFGPPTHTQVRYLESHKKLVDEKVSVLVSSIKDGLKDELKVELRGAIEEMIQDLMQSFMKNKFPADDLSGGASTPNEGS